MIGRQIKEFRTRNGLTQEELGQLIGVTTQAVSKWERGGAPDAELLPNIADALGVSIDALFGRTDNRSLEETITKELSAMSRREGFQKAFALCWAIEMGLTGLNSLKDKFTPAMLDTLRDEYGHQYYSKLLLDEGLVNVKLDSDSRYFFLMPEPAAGFKECLEDAHKIAETFALLSDKNILTIISYLYRRNNTPVSLSLISRSIGLSVEETETLMQRMCDCNLTDCVVIETENGDMKSYTFRQECTVIPLLFCAKELRDNKMLDFVTLFDRHQPLF